MPEIGLLELILIGTMAFLILGPERLPDFFAQVGSFIRQGRAWYQKLRLQLEQETNNLKQPIAEVKETIDKEIDSMDATSSQKTDDRS